MILSYRDRKNNIYLWNTSLHNNTLISSWKIFYEHIKSEVSKTGGYIDRFKIELNTICKVDNRHHLRDFNAMVLLPDKQE